MGLVMGYTRHINNVVETDAEVSFDLVVRDENDQYTYGGGRVTLRKPIADGQLPVSIDDAVANIVARGDAAYPKERPAQAPDDACLVARRLRDVTKGRNAQDRGGC